MSSSNMSSTVRMVSEVKRLTDADIDEVTAIIHKYLTAIIAPAKNDFEKLEWETLMNYFAAICKLQNPLAFPVLASIMKDSRKHEDFSARVLSELLDMNVDRVFVGNTSAALNHAALINGMSTGSFSRSGLNITETDFKPHNAGKASGTPGLFAMFGSSASGGAHVTPYYGQKSSGGYGGSYMSPYSGQIGGDLEPVSRGEIVGLHQAMRASIRKTQALEAELQVHKVTIDETAKLSRTNAADIKSQAAAQADTNKAQAEATKANSDMYQSLLQAKLKNQQAKADREEAAEKAKVERKATKAAAIDERIAERAFQVFRGMEEQKAAAARAAQQAAREEEPESDHEEEQEEQVGGKRKGKAPAVSHKGKKAKK